MHKNTKAAIRAAGEHCGSIYAARGYAGSSGDCATFINSSGDIVDAVRIKGLGWFLQGDKTYSRLSDLAWAASRALDAKRAAKLAA